MKKTKLKILVYGINFAPELTGIGKYAGEMSEYLASEGHEVRVITALPYYPAWKIGNDYHPARYVRETWQGVSIFRAPLWVPKNPGGAARLLHLGSFALSSLPLLIYQFRWKPDVVFLSEPPLFCAPAATLFARLSGAKSWLHIQDFEVDAAFDLSFLKGKRLRNLVLRAERWLMKKFDRVSSITQNMMNRALSKGVDNSKIISFPNWVDISKINPLSNPSSYRAELLIAPDAIIALYSGNMAGKQGLEILADVVGLLHDVDKLEFVFCGEGSGKENLVKLCSGLRNVRFLDLQPIERLNELLGLADIHLLPQRAGAADLVMPSKLTGMLASGRAIIATATSGTELNRIVSRCGLVVAPEDANALAAAIRLLIAEPETRLRLGLAARAHAEAHLDRDAVLKRFEEDLYSCIARPQ